MRRLLAIAAALAAAPLGAQETLPSGAGKRLVLEVCVQCHDFRWMTGQQKSEAAWRQTVNVMIWRGAPLKPGEAAVIARYLAEGGGVARGERSRSTEAALPDGPGRALLVSACVQCHDVGVTVNQRKTLTEWRHSIEGMVRLGAKLTGSEIEVLARYLAQSFGPTP